MRYILVFAVLETGDAGDAKKDEDHDDREDPSSKLRANEERQSMTELRTPVSRVCGSETLIRSEQEPLSVEVQ